MPANSALRTPSAIGVSASGSKSASIAIRLNRPATNVKKNRAPKRESSAGNLYRYFPSKEAIVEGLCELDQARRAESFAAFADLMARNGDLTEAMRKGLREHVFGKLPGKARLIVEIWAEAGRNPRVAEITRAIDADVLIGLERLMDVAKAAGAASPALDSCFGARFFFTFVAGLFKRIAIEADFDPEAETPMAIGVLKALFTGALRPEPGGETR